MRFVPSLILLLWAAPTVAMRAQPTDPPPAAEPVAEPAAAPVWQEMDPDDRERLQALRGEVRALTRVPLGSDSVVWTARLTVETQRPGRKTTEHLYWNLEHNLLGWKTDTAAAAPLVFLDVEATWAASLYLEEGLGQRIPPALLALYGFYDGKGMDYAPAVDKKAWGVGTDGGDWEGVSTLERTAAAGSTGRGKVVTVRKSDAPMWEEAMSRWQGLQPESAWRALPWPKGEVVVGWASEGAEGAERYRALGLETGHWAFDARSILVEDPERSLLDVARERAQPTPRPGEGQ